MAKYIATAVGAFRVLVDDVVIENVQSVTTPDFTRSMTEVKGAGILGTVRIPVPGQIEQMSITLEVSRSGGQKPLLIGSGEKKLEIRIGENVRTPSGALVPEGTKVFASGYSVKGSGGKVETGSPRGESFEYAVNRYREIVDGRETVLIDQINETFKIGGEDQINSLMRLL